MSLTPWLTNDELDHLETLREQLRKLAQRQRKLEAEEQRIYKNAEHRRANGVPADFDRSPSPEPTPNWLDSLSKEKTS